MLAIVTYNFRLYRLLRRTRPDLVQCHNTRSALMAIFAARASRIPLVFYVKGSLRSPLLDRAVSHLAKRTIFLNHSLKPAAWAARLNRSPERYPVLRLGVDLSSVEQAAQRTATGVPAGLDIDPRLVNFAFAGTLCRDKGIHVLLDAFAALLKRHPDCRLYVLGDTNDDAFRAGLAEQARSVGLRDDRVRFLGWRSDALDVLAAMDVYVLPSFDEGTPRSVVESMALGKPVIATRVGGIPELMRAGSGGGEPGILVAPADAAQLTAAMAQLAQKPELRREMGENGRGIAHEDYDIKSHFEGLWRILDDARR